MERLCTPTVWSGELQINKHLSLGIFSCIQFFFYKIIIYIQNLPWYILFFLTLFCTLSFLFLNFILFLNFTIFYWFCQILKWIHHRYTCVPHPEPSSLLPPHTLPLGRPSAPAPSIQYHASNLDWWLISYMVLYVFQCHSPKSSHPRPLPQSPKDCSIHQCLFCCLYTGLLLPSF